MNNDPLPTALLHQRAQDTARLLQALAHPTRLLVLCRLFRQGEASAGELSTQLGIAPSALSQHLARMREEGLLEQRRQAQQLFYRLGAEASAHVPALLTSLCALPPDPTPPSGDDPMKASALAAVLGLALTHAGAIAADGFWITPTIEGAGRIHPLPQAHYQPDARASYKVVFSLTGAGQPDQVNPGLQRVARTVNLYTHAGVPLNHLHFVAVASGAATPLVLDDAHYQAAFGQPNPNLPVIARLREAGVDVAVCGQAVAEHDYPYEAVDRHVTLALSALTTITELQQQGYALMPL
jgi:DNA-binding transcriptional ArsR family regulator/intracellular sulfur oxidation DsrE/DsrF family protein